MKTFAALLLAATLGRALAADPALPAFEAQEIDSKVAIGYGLAIGDVDGDGKTDILLADKTQIVWYHNPDWTRYVICENVTKQDNVCIAARDLDGDGKVEVAIGANWNPGDTVTSGSVHYLIAPADRKEKWEVVNLPNEPVVHRMKWIKDTDNKFKLVVVPLHGKGNKGGVGVGVKVLAYVPPSPLTAESAKKEWKLETMDDTLNVTHNFDIVPAIKDTHESVLLGGKQGIHALTQATPWKSETVVDHTKGDKPLAGVGEIRWGYIENKTGFIATVEPFHGNQLCVYLDGAKQRIVLDESFKEAHALACADLAGAGYTQIVCGWRNPNAAGKVGINIYTRDDAAATKWNKTVLDDNTMACEDIAVADLNGDGKLDIIAAGRATHNVKIYWNKGVPGK
jgi:hypothetical protein